MEQPGVNAPGTAKRTTVFPLHSSDILILLAGVFSNKSTLGTASPICNDYNIVLVYNYHRPINYNKYS